MASGRLNPVAWTEGMFLRPQHFQQHDVYLEERLRYHLHTLAPFHWGVRELAINEDALADHRFEIQQLEAVMPSGTIVKVGVNAVVEPRPFDPASERFNVYVGMRHVSEAESSVTAEQGEQGESRYQIVQKDLPDLTRAGAIAPVDLAYPNLRLFVSGEEQELELYEWFKLAEVVATGVHPPFVLADDYCPPLLAVQAFAPLRDRIDQIVAQIAAKVRVVAGRTSTTLAVADLPKYWMRYTLQRMTPLLRHLLSTGVTSPFQIYTALVETAGALAAFNLSEPAELPQYVHDDLLGCFGSLLAFLDDQLAEAVPDRFSEIELPFDAERKLYFSDALNTDLVDPHKHYYLAVKADLEAQDLSERVVKEAKVGALSTVKLAMRANIAGVPVEALPGAPTEIQARQGFQYFSLDPHHSKWKKVQEDYDFAVSLPKVESADVRLYVVEGER
jgi:type VI secretion system protein ImpJ